MPPPAPPRPFRPKPILETLVRHRVDFVLVGGLAGVARGSSYPTYDVDIAYARDRPNLERLAAALRELGATLRGAPPDVPFLLDAVDARVPLGDRRAKLRQPLERRVAVNRSRVDASRVREPLDHVRGRRHVRVPAPKIDDIDSGGCDASEEAREVLLGKPVEAGGTRPHRAMLRSESASGNRGASRGATLRRVNQK